jgi:hypothetical protein
VGTNCLQIHVLTRHDSKMNHAARFIPIRQTREQNRICMRTVRTSRVYLPTPDAPAPTSAKWLCQHMFATSPRCRLTARSPKYCSAMQVSSAPSSQCQDESFRCMNSRRKS